MRTVPEWIGKSADSPVPARVKARVITKFGGLCCRCGLPINDVRKPEFDHTIALVNWRGDGHGNRESNLSLICVPDHRAKTQADVAMKSSEAKRLKKRLRLQPRRTIPGRKFDGTPIPSRWR